MRTCKFLDNPTEPIHGAMNHYAESGRLKEVTKVNFSESPMFKWVRSDRHAQEMHDLVKNGYRIFLGCPVGAGSYNRFAIKGDEVFYVNALYEDKD